MTWGSKNNDSFRCPRISHWEVFAHDPCACFWGTKGEKSYLRQSLSLPNRIYKQTLSLLFSPLHHETTVFATTDIAMTRSVSYTYTTSHGVPHVQSTTTYVVNPSHHHGHHHHHFGLGHRHHHQHSPAVISVHTAPPVYPQPPVIMPPAPVYMSPPPPQYPNGAPYVGPMPPAPTYPYGGGPSAYPMGMQAPPPPRYF
jgi:hypothetical protein